MNSFRSTIGLGEELARLRQHDGNVILRVEDSLTLFTHQLLLVFQIPDITTAVGTLKDLNQLLVYGHNLYLNTC